MTETPNPRARISPKPTAGRVLRTEDEPTREIPRIGFEIILNATSPDWPEAATGGYRVAEALQRCLMAAADGKEGDFMKAWQEQTVAMKDWYDRLWKVQR